MSMAAVDEISTKIIKQFKAYIKNTNEFGVDDL
jgi:hypothetical protein